MRHSAPFFLIPILCLGTLSASAQTAGEMRIWTSADGRTMQARYLSSQAGQAQFQLANGQQISLTLDRLSAADRTYIESLAAANLTWPETVEVSTRALEVKAIEENVAQNKCVYRSEFFQFVTQDKIAVSVMKEIARTFESTHALVQALPWSVNPRPPADLGYYQAKFYLNRRNYILDGGPENSGGVYFTGDRIFRVPFDSLGLEMRGKTWFKNDNYRNDTLVHEITHQMMHDFLAFLPTWIVEGTAEYTEMLPYNAGKFLAGSHQRGLREYLKDFSQLRGIQFPDAATLVSHIQITRDQWMKRANSGADGQARLYHASNLLVYYFSHLDGDGSGARFIRYMKSIAEARDAWEAFFANPAVKREANGSFTYPSNLALPKQERDESFGRAQLAILIDGRDPAQLEADISSAFRKIGVR